MWNMLKSKEWEVKKSSLSRNSDREVTYEECRKYACNHIVSNLTSISCAKSQVIEIPRGSEFHFLGRVDTNIYINVPDIYYKSFKSRNFAAFSVINNKNISRYKGGIFFVYDILPEEIVHIFPTDSSTIKDAKSEEELTLIPSLWLNLEDLEALTLKLGVYNQITCKTKRNGEIIKPRAVLAFGEQADEAIQIAKDFGLICIKVYPDEDAIEYTQDLLYDYMVYRVADKMQELYDLNMRELLFLT